MAIGLGPNRYGKSAVRLLKVMEDGTPADLNVQVLCEGDFGPAHVAGDNSAVVPTDTMRNTVYVLAQDRLGPDIERFGRILAAHFLEFPQVTGITVTIEQRPWERIGGHGHAFTATAGVRVGRVVAGSMGDAILAGVRDLTVLKTTGSSFTGFARDRYTTLPEAEDRLLATEVTADWRYRSHPDSYSETWSSVRSILLEGFASHPSRSVQEQGWLMGRAVLTAHPDIEEISLHLPNKHHLGVDLARFGIEDRGVVFQPVDEPFGDISVTVRRH